MGKLIDADELYAAFRRDIMGGLNYDRILREAKPVDAVPVVRCKDRINQEIDELKENGEKHSDDVCQNGLLIAEGLRMALRIIREVGDEQP